jgi:DNA-binding XRE family transcriptional regulator
MDAKKRKKLEAKGWTIGNAEDFLQLTPAETALVEMKLALTAKLKALRAKNSLTQTDLAKLMGSSQSRVAKMEAGDASVSIDLLIAGLLAAGATRKDISKAIAA